MKQPIKLQQSVGTLIRLTRNEKKISLRSFEEMTGIPRGDLSKIERGQKNVTLATVEKIATALDCTAAFSLYQN